MNRAIRTIDLRCSSGARDHASALTVAGAAPAPPVARTQLRPAVVHPATDVTKSWRSERSSNRARTMPSFTPTYSCTSTLRNPTARAMRSAWSGASTRCAPRTRRASALFDGGPQPSEAQMCWATSRQASIAVMKVYLTPRSHSGSVRRRGSANVSRRSTARSSDTDRSSRRTRISSTTAEEALDELAVAAVHPRLLVGVDLPGRGDPPHPGRRIVVEEQHAVAGDPTGQLEGHLVVQDDEVDTGRKGHVERCGSRRRPPRGDVDVRVGPVRSTRAATVQQREPCTGAPQRVDHLRAQIVGNRRRHSGQCGTRSVIRPAFESGVASRCRWPGGPRSGRPGRRRRRERTREMRDDRIRPLREKLDLERKVRLLTGDTFWSLYAEPVVGLRRIVVSDGPAGVRGESFDERDPSLSLPSATALAATWDVDLARRYGAALGAEARRKGVDVVLGPTINLHRTPYGGRHFEAFSEDPLLTAELAAAYVEGVQGQGVAATPKHYVANDAETDRMTADSRVDERTLRELYLAAFEKAVVEACAWVVMSSYNAVNGPTMSENPLLRSPLKDEWGFDGLVMSDWTAVRSTEASANAAQDLVMPGPSPHWGDALVTAVREGRVPEAAVDEKVDRLLLLAARVGAVEGLAPALTDPPAAEDGAALAREVAAAGAVLVRNAGELPWRADTLRSVAVLGDNAARARTQGGGSAAVRPREVVSPLDGLRAVLGDRVRYRLGAQVAEGVQALDPATLTNPVTEGPGVRLRFLDGDGGELGAEDRLWAEQGWVGSGVPDGTVTSELRTT